MNVLFCIDGHLAFSRFLLPAFLTFYLEIYNFLNFITHREIHYDRASISSLVKVLISLRREKSRIQTSHRVAALVTSAKYFAIYIYVY